MVSLSDLPSLRTGIIQCNINRNTMTKEINVSVFVNKHYYQESSSRRTYGDILDNIYSILLDKSATITVSSPFSINKEKLPRLFESLLLTKDYQSDTFAFKKGNDDYLAKLDGCITSSYDEALTICAVGFLNGLEIYNTHFVASENRELFKLESEYRYNGNPLRNNEKYFIKFDIFKPKHDASTEEKRTYLIESLLNKEIPNQSTMPRVFHRSSMEATVVESRHLPSSPRRTFFSLAMYTISWLKE